MAQMVFRVQSVAAEANLRGTEMRRVRLLAIAGEAFQAEDTPNGDAPVAGSFEVLVNTAFAKSLQVGDEVTVVLKERE